MMKNEMTWEELVKEYEELTKQRDFVSKLMLERKQADADKKRQEAEKKKAELAAVKEKRYQEVVDAENKFLELRSAFLKDYGAYSETRTYNGQKAIDFMNWLFQ